MRVAIAILLALAGSVQAQEAMWFVSLEDDPSVGYAVVRLDISEPGATVMVLSKDFDPVIDLVGPMGETVRINDHNLGDLTYLGARDLDSGYVLTSAGTWTVVISAFDEARSGIAALLAPADAQLEHLQGAEARLEVALLNEAFATRKREQAALQEIARVAAEQRLQREMLSARERRLSRPSTRSAPAGRSPIPPQPRAPGGLGGGSTAEWPSSPQIPESDPGGSGWGDTFNSGAQSAQIPEMVPWGPPRHSARGVVDRRKLRTALGEESLSLGNVADLLQRALSESGHDGPGYLRTPGGFAIITRIEQIDELGQPITDSRYTDAIHWEPAPWWHPWEVLAAMMRAPRGFYRTIALIVTDAPVISHETPATSETFENWWNDAASVLPSPLRALPFTDGHDVTVLIYEFARDDDDSPPYFMDSNQSRLGAARHLSATPQLASLLR